MRLTWVVVTLAMFVVGLGACGDDGPCTLRRGTYVVKYTQRSGDCGALAEQVTVANQANDAAGKTFDLDPPCKGTVKNSTDNCVAVVESVCDEQKGGTSKTTASVRFDEDGDEGEGVSSIIARDQSGSVICTSSYDVTFKKQ